MSSRANQGTAGATTTPATAGHGEAKPKLFDEQGAIGKQFTGTPSSMFLRLSPDILTPL
jgi:hypothetical protein